METIGRYQIVSEIARGGMSTVYQAVDPNTGREVALKILPQALLDSTNLRYRFQREAETVARLNHPHIVPVYDFGEYKEQPFLVMRLMQGGTLTRRLADGAMPLNLALPILQQIAAALDEAHAHGVVHRDLKPDNILFDQYGAAFLSDFGIVKLAESNATFTDGGVVGTPRYISPEQAAGNQSVDSRSDIYSLGVIVFEMLTGTRPYEGDTALQIIMQHIQAPIPAITDRNPNLPPESQAIINRALAKAPDQRYQTATDLVHDLLKLPPGGAPTTRKPRSFYWLSGIIGTICLLGVCAGGWLWLRSGQLPAQTAPGFMVALGLVSATPPFTATATTTPTVTASLTATPTASATATSTPSPTATPTLTAVPTPTAVPPRPVISGSNLDQLGELAILTTEGPIFGIAVSPDSTLTAVIGNQSVSVYQTSTLTLLHRWLLPSAYRATFSWADSGPNTLAIMHPSAGLWVWEQQNGHAELTPLPRQSRTIEIVSWSPDNRWLAAGGYDRNITLWERGNWTHAITLTGHRERVLQLSWSPIDHDILASGSADNTARVWQIDSDAITIEQPVHTLSGMTTDVTNLVWSPDGEMLAVGGGKVVMWWDMHTGQNLGRRSNIASFAWLPDSAHIVMAAGNDIEVWATDGTLTDALSGHSGPILSLEIAALNPDWLLTHSSDLTIRVWSIAGQESFLTIPVQGEQISSVSWSPYLPHILSVSDTAVRVWDVGSGEEVIQLSLTANTRRVHWLSENMVLTQGGADNLVRIWDITTQKQQSLLANYSAQLSARIITWSPDSQKLAVLGADGVVRIWETSTGQIVQALFGDAIGGQTGGTGTVDWSVNDVAWSPDGSRLVTAGNQGTAWVWDFASGQRMGQMEHQTPVRVVAWSPDGRKIAAISSNVVEGQGHVHVWDVETQTQIWSKSSTIARVADLIWSPDSRHIAVGGQAGNGGVQVWDATNGDAVDWLALSDRSLIVGDLAWLADNTGLVTVASNEGAVHFWDAVVFGPAINNFIRLVPDVHTQGIQQLTLLPPADRWLTTLSNSGALRVWQLDESGLFQDGAPLPPEYREGYARASSPYNGKRQHMALSPDGKQLALVAADQTIKILGIVP